MITAVKSFLFAAAALTSSLSVHGEDPTAVVAPQAIPDVLINPGKGWVAYGMPMNHTPKVLALASIGYDRFEWSHLNPAEDVYNWQPVDGTLQAWKAEGKPFAFGVMCLNSHTALPGGYSTPKWVFDAGAQGRLIHLDAQKEFTSGTPGDKMVPNFDDPIYQAKLRKFVAALGARYDGNPDIAYIDIRDYGNWGEGHLYPFLNLDPTIKEIAPEQLRALLQIYRDAFHHTQLIVPWGREFYSPIYDWAIAQGIGLRRDGICGNSDGGETARALGKAPAVFEFYDSYANMKQKGWWDGRVDINGDGHPLSGCVEKGHPSWIGLGYSTDADQLVTAERPLVERLANRMGYHFVLTRAEFPRTVKSGQTATVHLNWSNDGVAPVYIPCAVALALLDDKNQPVETAWPSACHPSAWAPGQSAQEDAQATFTQAKPGAYRLAVGLVDAPGSPKPIIRLGIAGRTDSGWYPLGAVEITP